MDRKRSSEGTLEGELSLRKSKRKKNEETDYTKCVICQDDTKGLLNIQKGTVAKLKLALDARQDSVADRLREDINDESWLTKAPKWHATCRNWYTLRKSYELAKSRRLQDRSTEEPQAGTSSAVYTTRSVVPSFKPKQMCLVCGKEYYRSKKPTLKVATKNREDSIRTKAKLLGREDILLRLEGHGHDMVANDICYHRECMAKFINEKVSKSGKSNQQALYDKAFDKLIDELEKPLLTESKGYMVRSLRDRFRSILKEDGVANPETFRSSQLKVKLCKYFGMKISIIQESGGSGFICASNIPLGDALAKLYALEKESKLDKRMETVVRAAKILREEAKACKKSNKSSGSVEMSVDAASKLVPDSFFNFTACLVSDKHYQPEEDAKRFQVDRDTSNRAIIVSQQLLQHITSMQTPLGTATALHLYNETRSKSLITLNNRLGQGISYDSLQRQLTAKSISVMQQEEEEGVFIPENISKVTHLPHLFATDNLDWRNKTLQGGSFHATTAIIIENSRSNLTRNKGKAVCVPLSSSSRARSIGNIQDSQLQSVHLSEKERAKSRSLESITSLENIQTECDGFADNLLLMWKLARVSSSTSTLFDVSSPAAMLPGFSAFCSRLLPVEGPSRVGYFPILPQSPTNPAVLQEEMKRLVKASRSLGNEWTIITGDQATYELARVIKEKNKDMFDKVILLLGGFHQAHNFLKAICKIMRDSGAESILTSAGLCEEGTARKIFGEKAEYYQTLHAVQLLNEAMWRLLYKAFEEWCLEKGCIQWAEDLWLDVQMVLENKVDGAEQLEQIKVCNKLDTFKELLENFQAHLSEKPNAKYWLTFLEMSDILQKFLYYQREGDWFGHLHESANMLPYLTAAGHYKYGQQSLPQYLYDMKNLENEAPNIYKSFVEGNFVARRAEGSHNAVSPDMLLEQTYNADAKETSGLDGIAMKEAARAKWIYTKPLTAAASFYLKSILDMNVETQNPHHESGKARIVKDAQIVTNIVETNENNPFTSSNDRLVNIATGELANEKVQDHLLTVKEIGNKALLETIVSKEKKKSVVKLQTFHVQKKISKKTQKPQPPGKSNEIVALMRMTQVAATGGEVNVVEWIGQHECADFPPSLFDEHGHMRAPGTKATLVKALKMETGVSAVSELPGDRMKTAVIIDAMYDIRRWSFEKNVPFPDVAKRFTRLILDDVPQNTTAIHLCCDRYNDQSLKSGERSRREPESGKVYEVSDAYRTPDPKEFFKMSENKAALLDYLCQKLTDDELTNPEHGCTKLYLAGGFQDVEKSVLLTDGCVTDIGELASTQEEADTRIILHAMYATVHDGVQRIVIHGNDTDIIVLALYYYVAFLRDLPLQELWIRTEVDSYLPLHKIANALDADLCHALPLIHSISGRDTTSYPYFTGKKAWIQKSKEVEFNDAAHYAENDFVITEKVREQTRQLFLSVYSAAGQDDTFKEFDQLRAHKFLNSNNTALKMLPPTEDAFEHHLKRAAFATIIDKTAHLPKPELPDPADFGWTVHENKLVPTAMTKSPWPENISKGISCGCKKGCNRNCSCAKKSVQCYIGCKCKGLPETCSRAKYAAKLDTSDEDSDDSDLDDLRSCD